MKLSRVSELLDDLIEVCREGEVCYSACARLVNGDPVRRSLKHRARHAARARKQLTKLRKTMGEAEYSGPPLSQPLSQSAQSGCAFGAMTDHASALGMCERLESVALMRYRDALDFDLPEPVRLLLRQQFDALIERHANRDGAKRRSEKSKRPVVLALAR